MSWSGPTTLATGSDAIAALAKTLTGINAAVNDLVIVSGKLASGGGGLTGVTVSDSSTNSWTVVQFGSGGDRWFMAWAVIAVGKSLSSGTITITRTGTTNITSYAAAAISFTGEALASTEGTGVRNTAGNTTGFSPSVTGGAASNSGCLNVALCGDQFASPGYSEASGWTTAISVAGASVFVALAYQVNSGTSGLTHNPTLSGGIAGNHRWGEVMLAFVAAGGGGVTPTQHYYHHLIKGAA